MIASMYTDITRLTNDRLRTLTVEEARAVRSSLSLIIERELTRIRIPSPAKLRVIVTTNLVQGAPVRDWWRQQNRGAQLAYRAQMQVGMLQGEGINSLTRRIRGRPGPNGRIGGVISIGRRAAETLVRTAVTEIANKAALLTYAKNPTITVEYEYLAVTDDNTTDICMALNGSRWRYDDIGGVVPPQHWGCRSTIAPVILASVL